MSSYNMQLPDIYAHSFHNTNVNYPVFKNDIAEFCDEVDLIAQEIVAKAIRPVSINDFIPKIKFKIFGAFSSTTINGDRRNRDEMDGGERAMSILFGGLIAGVASFVFGSFYHDYKDSLERIERCDEFKENYIDIWRVNSNEHCTALKNIQKEERQLAVSEKRSAIINMSITIGIVASGLILVVAGVFASLPVAIAGTSLFVVISIVAMGKFGMTYFDKSPMKKAQKILDRIESLKNARAPLNNNFIPNSYRPANSFIFPQYRYAN